MVSKFFIAIFDLNYLFFEYITMKCENNGFIAVKYSDIAKGKQREYY